MPFPIDIDVLEGTAISDGVQTLTHKEVSHVKLLRVDAEGFLVYEVTPPKKISSKTSLKDYLVEDQLIDTEKTGLTPQGEPLGEYKYFKRSDGSYHSIVTGKKTGIHGIELGKLTDKDSPLGTVIRLVAYNFGTTKFSRKELSKVIPKKLTYAQKFKSILGILHKEGYLVKEVDTTKAKAKETYTATEKLQKFVLPSPVPEQT